MAFRDKYGAGPLHLIAVVASLAIAGYALLETAQRIEPLNFAIWFGLAIVAHDLIAFPLYSALAALAGRAFLAKGETGRMALNHLRFPAMLSAFAFVVWFPLILGVSSDFLEEKTGIGAGAYLGRWLLLTAVLFVGSGVVLAIRMRRQAQAQG